MLGELCGLLGTLSSVDKRKIFNAWEEFQTPNIYRRLAAATHSILLMMAHI